MNKLTYLLNSLVSYGQSKECIYCKSENINVIDRKYLVTRLMRCENCGFQFRLPVDTTISNRKFYQKAYKQAGITTDLPSDEELRMLISNNFENSIKDFSPHIKLIKTLFPDNPSPKVLDYGANWGYTSYQFRKAGFEVDSFEISVPRAEYGNSKLGVEIKTEASQITGEFDVVFSSHVIEHLPDVNKFMRFSEKHLKKDGVFIAYCPNGSEAFRKKWPEKFHKFWGQVHPNYLSAEFYEKVLAGKPYIICSTPLDLELVKGWKNDQKIADLGNSELLVISRLNQSK